MGSGWITGRNPSRPTRLGAAGSLAHCPGSGLRLGRPAGFRMVPVTNADHWMRDTGDGGTKPFPTEH
jgi:hypothetical protein